MRRLLIQFPGMPEAFVVLEREIEIGAVDVGRDPQGGETCGTLSTVESLGQLRKIVLEQDGRGIMGRDSPEYQYIERTTENEDTRFYFAGPKAGLAVRVDECGLVCDEEAS